MSAETIAAIVLYSMCFSLSTWYVNWFMWYSQCLCIVIHMCVMIFRFHFLSSTTGITIQLPVRLEALQVLSSLVMGYLATVRSDFILYMSGMQNIDKCCSYIIN